MSTRTDWGWFAKDGTPIAVGDAWHLWECPKADWAEVGYEHFITGEWISEGMARVNCPTKFIAVKTEKCERCGAEFRYP